MMDSLLIAIKNLTSKPTILCDPIFQTAAYVGARQLDFKHFENSISPKPIKPMVQSLLVGPPLFWGLNSPKSATNPFECWLNPHESPEIDLENLLKSRRHGRDRTDLHRPGTDSKADAG